MKFAATILLTIILSFVFGLYFPWWSIALVSFLVALFIYQKPVIAWLAGFAGVFLFWALLAWWIDAQNDSILSRRIALLLNLGGGSSSLLILLTGLVGAIIGSLAALSGSLLRRYLEPRWPLE
jgi:hypothetical protein